jgi:hypothetical protein
VGLAAAAAVGALVGAAAGADVDAAGAAAGPHASSKLVADKMPAPPIKSFMN